MSVQTIRYLANDKEHFVLPANVTEKAVQTLSEGESLEPASTSSVSAARLEGESLLSASAGLVELSLTALLATVLLALSFMY